GLALPRLVRWSFPTAPRLRRAIALDAIEAALAPTQLRHAAARAAVRVRGRHLLVLDLVAIVVAAYLALAIRYDRLFAALPSLPTLQVIAILLVGRTLINIRGGLYGRRWRFASVPDLQRIVVAVGLGSFVAATVFYAAATIVDPSW